MPSGNGGRVNNPAVERRDHYDVVEIPKYKYFISFMAAKENINAPLFFNAVLEIPPIKTQEHVDNLEATLVETFSPRGFGTVVILNFQKLEI